MVTRTLTPALGAKIKPQDTNSDRISHPTATSSAIPDDRHDRRQSLRTGSPMTRYSSRRYPLVDKGEGTVGVSTIAVEELGVVLRAMEPPSHRKRNHA